MLKPQLLIFLLLHLTATCLHATQKEQAKTQLTNINKKMSRIQTNIHEDETHREQLSKSLVTTDKEISQQVKSLHSTQQMINQKTQSIQNITNQLNTLNFQLDKESKALATHLQLRYKMHHAHPMEWLFNQEKPSMMSRFMTYYQHLIQADAKLILSIRETKVSIETHKEQLSHELAELSNLQKNIKIKYESLATLKSRNKQIMQQLSQGIQTKQQQLANYKQDQARLQALIEQLSRVPFNKPSFKAPSHTPSQLTLNNRFKSPLQGNQRQGRSYNQGILFSAQEGTPVTAILPGRVIFSDWLNGYGLLLIIDHGDGMMSLYAHNESLFKKTGMMVKSGDEIATVGHTGGIRENGLYFELRSRGKVIPPRQWLA